MGKATYPALFQINTRIWLRELGQQLGRAVTFDQVPDDVLDQIAHQGFDWLWLLGVWQTGPAGRMISRTKPDLQREYQKVLPDLTEDDICGSPFAVQSYTVHTDFGGNGALLRLRQRLHARGLYLMLDFVPNHTALDHPWVWQNPEFYVRGEEVDLARTPQNYCRVETWRGPRILAHGRDPYFPGWTDTLQLNYRHPALREAMLEELEKIARLCDGVRCDMAMLLLPDVFLRTWGRASLPEDGRPPVDAPFWPEAVERVRQNFAQFVFLAEAYWHLEWTLQQQGFDYTYDKRFYDRLRSQDAEAVRGHLHADPDFQRKSVRFLENHDDEPRAEATFPPKVHQAAAVLAYLVPGMRFFQEGQFEGRRIKIPVHLGRRPAEPVDTVIREFYRRLLLCVGRPEVRTGRWQLLECRPGGENNATWKNYIAFAWEPASAGTRQEPANGQRLVIGVNFGPNRGQAHVPLPFPDLRGNKFLFRDLMNGSRHEWHGDDLADKGLWLDTAEWGYSVFEMSGI